MNNEILEKYKQYLLANSLSLNYYYRIRIFLNFLDKKTLDYNTVTQDDIINFLNEKKYNEQSKNSFINAGRNFYKFLGKDVNEWQKFKLVKVEYKIPEYLSVKELEQGISYLITYHTKRISSIKIRALMHFIFYSGARKEEVYNLKREHFNFEENAVKFFGKGKKERIAYFPDRIGKEIRDYFASEQEITNAFNVKIGKIFYYVKLMGKYLGKNIYPHLLRHSICREMLRQKIPLKVVSCFMGHSSITTTERYADENEEGRRNLYHERIK